MSAAFQARAMVLAAGRGERMRPLTDRCPKPLLPVRGKALLQYHLEALAREGFDRVVINTAWLGEQIEGAFGAEARWDGSAAPQHLAYSHEGRDFGGALETAGGDPEHRPQHRQGAGDAAGDVFMPGFAFGRAAFERFAAGRALAHLWLVPNPPHNPRGDFGLDADGRALNEADTRYTFSTVGLYRRAFFDRLPTGNPQGLKAPLAPLLRSAMDQGLVTAELWRGAWTDVGTPERLAQLDTP